MKNSASNLTEKQALQVQATKLLPAIAHALSKLGYQEAAHQRLSQQNSNLIMYQGLTRASHVRFGQVMIKWQLSSNDNQNRADLNHEITVLKELNSGQTTQLDASAIAPRLLDYKTINIDVFEQTQPLSLLAMPYYINGSLAKLLKQSLADRQKYELVIKAAHLVGSLHKSGWIHGDIKPSNILVEDNLSLLLTDFALARQIDSTQSFNRYVIGDSAGTPAYLAPECWQGQSATVQSDIYAFGIMIYEILMGKRPFTINSQNDGPLQEWALQHCQQPIPNLPKQYAHYQNIINKTLAKRVDKRYLHIGDSLRDLKKLN